MEKELNQLKNKYFIDWREFEIDNLFDKPKLKSIYPKNFDKDSDISKERTFEFDLPLVNAKSGNNGIMYFGRSSDFESLELSIGVIGDGAVSTGDVNPQPQRTGALYNAYLIKPRWRGVTRNHIFYFSSVMKKAIKSKFGYENKASWDKVKLESIKLPVNTDGQIAFDYIDEFVNTLEAERLATLEAYLQATGLKDVELSEAEAESLQRLQINGGARIDWREFNLQILFGKSSRGRRLKSADRISGKLPFVTAGEASTGISSFIGNNVSVFKENTVTIDMFGSAKYRNYEYGADDHIAVVHTEKIDKFSVLFVTSACHKSAHAGQFDYSRNFYASDADELMIQLPVAKDGTPDYNFMNLVTKATQKLVMKNVVDWLDKRIEATQQVISN